MKRFFTLILASLMLVSCAAPAPEGGAAQGTDTVLSGSETETIEKVPDTPLEARKAALQEVYKDCKKNNVFLSDYLDKVDASMADGGDLSDSDKASLEEYRIGLTHKYAESRISKYSDGQDVDERDISGDWEDFDYYYELYLKSSNNTVRTGYLYKVMKSEGYRARTPGCPDNVLLYPLAVDGYVGPDWGIPNPSLSLCNIFPELDEWMGTEERIGFVAMPYDGETSKSCTEILDGFEASGLEICRNVNGLPENGVLVLMPGEKLHSGMYKLENIDQWYYGNAFADWDKVTFG